MPTTSKIQISRSWAVYKKVMRQRKKVISTEKFAKEFNKANPQFSVEVIKKYVKAIQKPLRSLAMAVQAV